ncbi:MAG: ABC transporter substrate-binding protein, partial [Planctomycetota bacterium]
DASSAEIDRLVSERMAVEPSLYALDATQLAALRPDLIVTQTLCDVCAVPDSDVERVASKLAPTPRVLKLQPKTLDDVFDSIREVAAAVDARERGEEVVAELRQRVDRVAARRGSSPPLRVALLEWLDPPFAAGHWNPELVRLAGGSDVFGESGEKSRRVTWDEVAAADPDVIVVACCGLDRHRAATDIEQLSGGDVWPNLRAVRSGRVLIFDGSQFFNRSGPRLVESLEMLADGLHRLGAVA